MKDGILAFVRAVSWGSLAGGGPFLIITVPISLQTSEWWQTEALWLAVMPMVVAAAVVALTATFLGLPLTAWLARQQDEDRMTYVVAGLGSGILVPIALVLALFGDWEMGAILAIPGAFAGTVTGTSWGRWREKVAARRDAENPPRFRAAGMGR